MKESRTLALSVGLREKSLFILSSNSCVLEESTLPKGSTMYIVRTCANKDVNSSTLKVLGARDNAHSTDTTTK